MSFSQLFALLDGKSNGTETKSYSGHHSSWMMINSLLSLAFGVTLTCFSSFHLFLVLSGATTIEMGSDEYKQYDLGCKKNFYAIFGDNCLFWFLPIATMQGDGYEFLNYDDEDRQLLHDMNGSMDNQDDEEESDYMTDLSDELDF